jgi:glycosidase
MSQNIDKRLILNRRSIQELHRAGLAELTGTLHDISAARKLALWHQVSGADVYLLILLIAAARQICGHYFSLLQLEPDLDRLKLASTNHSLPELGTAYRAFLEHYPREDLTRAIDSGTTEERVSSRRHLLTDFFILEFLHNNPALQPFRKLFDDSELNAQFDYRALLKQLNSLSDQFSERLAWRKSLPQLLQAPRIAAPTSLVAQLAYVTEHWAPWLQNNILEDIKLACAIKAEESRPHLPGPGPSQRPRFGASDGSDAPAAFTTDTDWMSSAVLLAKSIHVWLGQLSSRYQRPITTLSDIPDEELAQLADQGFNALWLIGIWERSSASKKIKQLCGNPEAEASAYALHAYRVAADLGGEEALSSLERRCIHHGIRLACDVVPNHTGIDSEWMRQHPDWFVQSDHPPYPAYRFSGPDLCTEEGISIRIEDGYWDHSDASVVCEHHDHNTGQRRYIYHGNDGTHMPWNDTAQLNFLLPEVRQAMSDLIVSVAQRFSLIRFDAAMTLARKHYRRLWFPPPGGSAGVPSRSTFWMSDAAFDTAFPVEFWREVVDRINCEAPDTLLIAEAFWLMESYFVRNLGMHRVYNSAFMNMLKREENAKYRSLLKETLAYNPEILKRYVNFMNNPDEATAVEQFGKSDKYFGVATLLATLPGLPMFGHGQIEGYREKYGMEYRRAYWQETPDSGFVAHHERQIFPLLRIRKLFAGVEHFSLYDFATNQGIDENVFAFSNGPANEKVLVVYNNAARQTTGRLHQAAPKATPETEGRPQPMPQLNQALGLTLEAGEFCRYRDLRGAEHLEQVEPLARGLELHLEAYEHRIMYDFQLINDTDGSWHRLFQELQGRAVANLDLELLRLRHQPLWQSFNKLFDYGRLHVLAGALAAAPWSKPVESLIDGLVEDLHAFAKCLNTTGRSCQMESVSAGLRSLFTALSDWLNALSSDRIPRSLLAKAWHGSRTQSSLGIPLLSWLMLHQLGKTMEFTNDLSYLEHLKSFGLDYAWQEASSTPEQQNSTFVAMLLMRTSGLSPDPAIDEATFAQLCTDPSNASFLGINVHAGERWIVQESLVALAGAVALQAELMQLQAKEVVLRNESEESIAEVLRQRLARAAAVGYRLDKFLKMG